MAYPDRDPPPTRSNNAWSTYLLIGLGIVILLFLLSQFMGEERKTVTTTPTPPAATQTEPAPKTPPATEPAPAPTTPPAKEPATPPTP